MPLFKKPNDMTYTEMAMWIDEHAYDKYPDDEKLFLYMFHLSKMLALKSNYFSRVHQYDDFAVYAATEMLLRYKRKQQFEINEDGEPKLPKVKSVLNYLKSILGFMRIEFSKSDFYQLPDYYVEDVRVEFSIDDYLSESTKKLRSAEFCAFLSDLGKTIREYLRKIPINKTNNEWCNIVTSVLLTTLNMCTLRNTNKELFNNKFVAAKLNKDNIEELFGKEKEDPVILFHLDDKYKNYILILTKVVIHNLSMEVSDNIHMFMPTHTNMYNLMASDFCYSEEDGD